MAERETRFGVTGASGFIGSHLVKTLRATPGTAVTVLHHRKNSHRFDAKELQAFVKNQDVIYHLAGVNRDTPEAILRGNILGTLDLVEALRRWGDPGTRIVFTSSSQVYKIPAHAVPVRETRAAEPATLYGAAKKAAEDVIRLSGLDHTLLRLGNVYGPGCRADYNSVVATFCDRAARGMPLIITGGGRQGRDFLYIDDVVSALVLAGRGTARSLKGVFNVASGRVTTLKQIVSQLRRNVDGLKVEYRSGAGAGLPSYCCDAARFRKRTGWKPKVSLPRGIRQTLRWTQEKAAS